MNNAEQISARLQELTSTIEQAQQKLGQGEFVDLSHLDHEVGQLCDQVIRLKAEEAAKVQPVMGTMISKLEEFGMALKAFQNNLKSGN